MCCAATSDRMSLCKCCPGCMPPFTVSALFYLTSYALLSATSMCLLTITCLVAGAGAGAGGIQPVSSSAALASFCAPSSSALEFLQQHQLGGQRTRSVNQSVSQWRSVRFTPLPLSSVRQRRIVLLHCNVCDANLFAHIFSTTALFRFSQFIGQKTAGPAKKFRLS